MLSRLLLSGCCRCAIENTCSSLLRNYTYCSAESGKKAEGGKGSGSREYCSRCIIGISRRCHGRSRMRKIQERGSKMRSRFSRLEAGRELIFQTFLMPGDCTRVSLVFSSILSIWRSCESPHLHIKLLICGERERENYLPRTRQPARAYLSFSQLGDTLCSSVFLATLTPTCLNLMGFPKSRSIALLRTSSDTPFPEKRCV